MGNRIVVLGIVVATIGACASAGNDADAGDNTPSLVVDTGTGVMANHDSENETSAQGEPATVGDDTATTDTHAEEHTNTDAGPVADTGWETDTHINVENDSTIQADTETETGSDGEWHSCNGERKGYDAVVEKIGSKWVVTDRSGTPTWSGDDMMAAVARGFEELDTNRSYKQSVLVLGDGMMYADQRLRIPSYTVLNVCGTIDVQGTPVSDRSPFYINGKTDVDIPNARVTGSPAYGMFIRNSNNIHLGHIVMELKLDSWIGVRVDNNPKWPDFPPLVENLTIDYVEVHSSGSHGVETYGVDGIQIGEFVGDHTGGCGLILNHSINAEVGSVTCNECAYIDTGYAAFRVANSNGKIGDDFPAGNIHVESVTARGGGRGIFSVSGSGGLTIDRIDLADCGNDTVLLQNAYNTIISAESGVASGGRLYLSNDSKNTTEGTYETSYNVTFQNLTLQDGAHITENYCNYNGQGDRNNRAYNIDGPVDMCYP